MRIRNLRAESLESRQLLHGGGLASPESIGEHVEAVIDRYDTNEDGSLGEGDELSERAQERLAEIDANEDGAVTSEELTTHYETRSVSRALGLGDSFRHRRQADVEARVANAIAVVDDNGNEAIDKSEVSEELWGQLVTDESVTSLNAAELAPLVEANDAAARDAYIARKVDRLFERYAGEDGESIVLADLSEHRQSHLAGADGNEDGSISRDEATAFVTEQLAAREAAWAERQAAKEAQEAEEEATSEEGSETTSEETATEETSEEDRRDRHHRGRRARGGRGRR